MMQLLRELTKRLMTRALVDEKSTMRASLKQRMDESTWDEYDAQGLDPLFLYYRMQAIKGLRQQRSAQHAQAAPACSSDNR